MMTKAFPVLTAALVGCLWQPAAAGDGFSFSSGFDYSSGKYGNTVATEVLAFPFAARYDMGALTLKVSVPYLQITGPGSVVGVSATGGVIVVAGGGDSRGRVSGWGDMTGGANYNVFYDAERGILLDVGGKVKLATADSARGLGTGKSDQSLQLDGYQILGQNTLMGTVGYKWMGKPDGSQFRDAPFASLGLSRQLSDTVSVGGILDWRRSVVASRSDQVEFTLYALRNVDKHWRLQAYLYGGSNSASPDVGGGASVNYRY